MFLIYQNNSFCDDSKNVETTFFRGLSLSCCEHGSCVLSDKKLIKSNSTQIKIFLVNIILQNGVKQCTFYSTCDIVSRSNKVCEARQMSVNESINVSILSLSVPCDSPPLTISSTGCCSQSCWSWDDCLECSYDNYYLCVDQVRELAPISFQKVAWIQCVCWPFQELQMLVCQKQICVT